MRFYDIQEGNILIKGRDIREYGQRELRDMIGYVPQKAFLFSGTIADNLRHGKKDATDLEMHHAAAIAQIDDFIREHKKGLDAPVSQGGGNFSGHLYLLRKVEPPYDCLPKINPLYGSYP